MKYLWFAIAAFILYLIIRKKKNKKDFSPTLNNLSVAAQELKKLTDFDTYFSNYQKNEKNSNL